jgi:hypothetical protein
MPVTDVVGQTGGRHMARSVVTIAVSAYRLVYLATAVCNLLLLLVDVGIGEKNIALYGIYLAGLTVNAFSFLEYARGRRWACELETLLSVGRILGILIAMTIVSADLVAVLSPVGWILWHRVMVRTFLVVSRRLYWAACGVLLCVECVYLSCLIDAERWRTAARGVV